MGFELVAVHLGLQTLGQRADDRRVAFGDDGRFPKGPAQVRVAQFGPAQALDPVNGSSSEPRISRIARMEGVLAIGTPFRGSPGG